jgi:hypothetical protein
MSALTRVLTVVLFVMLLGGTAGGESGTVAGAVHATGLEEKPFALPGVTLTLRCGSEAARTVVSDERGEFRFVGVPAGSCALATDIQGFKSTTASFNSVAGHQFDVPKFDVPISLELETLYTGLMVTSRPLSGTTPAAKRPLPPPHHGADRYNKVKPCFE